MDTCAPTYTLTHTQTHTPAGGVEKPDVHCYRSIQKEKYENSVKAGINHKHHALLLSPFLVHVALGVEECPRTDGPGPPVRDLKGTTPTVSRWRVHAERVK